MIKRAILIERLGREALAFVGRTHLPADVQFLEGVLRERSAQLKKWGTQDHSLGHWANILTEELGEFVKEVVELESGRETNMIPALQKLAQTAAVALSIFVEYLSPRLIEAEKGS